MFWFKKIVRAILNLLPVFFVVFLTSPTFALKYPINTISFAPDTINFRKVKDFYNGEDVYTYFPKLKQFGIYSVRGSGFPSGFQFPKTYRFTGDYDFSMNYCSMPINSSSYYSDGVRQFNYPTSNAVGYTISQPSHINGSRELDIFDISNSSDSPFDLDNSIYSQLNDVSFEFNKDVICNIQNQDYTPISDNLPPSQLSLPKWNFGTLSNIGVGNSSLRYEKSVPYTYQFDSIYLNGTDKADDGFVYRKYGIKMSEIFKVNVPTFSMLHMNFNDFLESQNWLSPDDTDDNVSTERVYEFDLGGKIVFDDDFSLGDSAQIVLGVGNYYNPRPVLATLGSPTMTINNKPIYKLKENWSDIICDIEQYHVSFGDSENSLKFICHYDPVEADAFSSEINFRFLNLNLQFNGNGTSSWNFDKFLETTGDYTFTDFYIATNDDFTDSGWSGSSNGSGGNISSAPGTISNSGMGTDGGAGEIDYNSSLSGLFNFTFINPFAPIFNLFNSGSNCVQIPTIAGMIHSEETQVCPWFDSSVRNIVTPVLGISSMMLVFGFAVRWLGSSSGNMFEDSSHETLAPPGASGHWGRRKK